MTLSGLWKFTQTMGLVPQVKEHVMKGPSSTGISFQILSCSLNTSCIEL